MNALAAALLVAGVALYLLCGLIAGLALAYLAVAGYFIWESRGEERR